MAIGFARVKYITAGNGGSVVAASAYNARSERTSTATGVTRSYANKSADLVHNEVILPAGAPDRFRDGEVMWNAAEQAEMVGGTRPGRPRKIRERAQFARGMILALPKELSPAEMTALTREFVRQQFTRHNLAVEFAIHKPHTGDVNWHAHLLISSRHVGPDGFGLKARDLDPSIATVRGRPRVVEQDHWELVWRDFQNSYFREHGYDFTVDPFKAEPSVHLGPGARVQDSELAAVNDNIEAQTRADLLDPAKLLERVTYHNAVFTEDDIVRLLDRYGYDTAEINAITADALSHSTVIPLYSQAGAETPYYTLTDIRAQETAVLRNSDKIAKHRFTIKDRTLNAVTARYTLNDEQKNALRHATRSNGFAVIEGRAGTGKSHQMNAIRETYERDGYDVIGLGPTNVVAADIRAAGFRTGRTVALEMTLQAHDRTSWDRNTVVMIDEAAMLDTKSLESVTDAAAKSGAKLILIGDSRQFESVAYGGMMRHLIARHSSAELEQIERQQSDWQRTASIQLSKGEIRPAIDAYAKRGFVTWSADLDAATTHLIDQYAKDSKAAPSINRFVYASTNRQVNTLNERIRAMRVARGDIEQGHTFETKRGRIDVAAGDRIQLYENDRAIGLYNGTFGTVKRIRGKWITVEFDDRSKVQFNAETFTGWGHGYAGTTYRGQGRTNMQVYALYDSKIGWNVRTAYVGLTRHRSTVRLYVPKTHARDLNQLIDRLAIDYARGASVTYKTLEDTQRHRVTAPNQVRTQQPTLADPNTDLRSDPITALHATRILRLLQRHDPTNAMIPKITASTLPSIEHALRGRLPHGKDRIQAFASLKALRDATAHLTQPSKPQNNQPERTETDKTRDNPRPQPYSRDRKEPDRDR